VIVSSVVVIVPSVWIESRSRLIVSMRLVDVGVRVRWVIVTKRDAFEITGRACNSVGLAERNIVRRAAFKYEVCR
jgi:hypothetical protein